MAEKNSVAQNCYTMAYYILPPYIFNEKEKVLTELKIGRLGAMFFYTLTCMQANDEPTPEAMNALAVDAGSFENHDYYVITYPTPPPVNMMNSVEELFDSKERSVLAPYFSAVIQEKESKKMRYFILGQSPHGMTTFRSVTIDAEGMCNANLGPGCLPELPLFLEMLDNHLTKL
ncbi:hypothetical protein [Candidatus Uabimicrobium sp. HlEnr_7]|uniref:hypothetical protein n=1 Tax=Candidatus Uabimicrobium helgolandensis TaxID=3095367 RepID=UPI003556EEDF